MKDHTYAKVRAVYHEGVLTVLDPLILPDGVQVEIDIHLQADGTTQREFPRNPTVLVPAEELNRLIGISEAGGDALKDSEELYDSDRD